MNTKRNSSLALELAGCAALIAAAVKFDVTLSNNDFSVAMMFLCLAAFVAAGFFRNPDDMPLASALPFSVGAAGAVFVIAGLVATPFGAAWNGIAIACGVFAIVSATSFYKVGEDAWRM